MRRPYKQKRDHCFLRPRQPLEFGSQLPLADGLLPAKAIIRKRAPFTADFLFRICKLN